MILPTNVQKLVKNNVSYDHDGNTVKVGIRYVENKLDFHQIRLDLHESRADLVTFYTDQRDFYQYIKDQYDAG